MPSRSLEKSIQQGHSSDLSFDMVSQISSYAPVEGNGHSALMALSVCFLAYFHGRFMSVEDFVIKKTKQGI